MINEEISDKAAIFIEEIGISGDQMVEVKGGSMYLHDIMASFYQCLVKESDSLPCGSESLFIKYIKHIIESEGSDYIQSIMDGRIDQEFTDIEIKELSTISNEVNNDC